MEGKGTGLKLTECVANDEELIFSDTLPLNDETAELIFAEFGVELAPTMGKESW